MGFQRESFDARLHWHTIFRGRDIDIDKGDIVIVEGVGVSKRQFDILRCHVDMDSSL